jgi:hypothetical protein
MSRVLFLLKVLFSCIGAAPVYGDKCSDWSRSCPIFCAPGLVNCTFSYLTNDISSWPGNLPGVSFGLSNPVCPHQTSRPGAAHARDPARCTSLGGRHRVGCEFSQSSCRRHTNPNPSPNPAPSPWTHTIILHPNLALTITLLLTL